MALESESSETLEAILLQAESQGIKTSAFREPDIGNELTAVAFEPCEASRILLANLPCIGKNMSEEEQRELQKRERKLREQARLERDSLVA